MLQYLTNMGKDAEMMVHDPESFVNEDINGLPHLEIAMVVNFLAHLPWFCCENETAVCFSKFYPTSNKGQRTEYYLINRLNVHQNLYFVFSKY